jgi:pyruvate-formate lyase
VSALVETFFSQGGQELQINRFDVETLRQAREHPEQYGDLVVRVAGFNARFVDLSAAEQEELIARGVVSLCLLPGNRDGERVTVQILGGIW